MTALAPRLAGGQHGAVLAVSLCILIGTVLIGVAAARTAVLAEKSARIERDRHVALHAAEAALADAERDIEGGADPAGMRAALFAPDSVLAVRGLCGAGEHDPALGLCRAPAWQRADLAADGSGAPVSVPYGRFTGASLPTGQAGLPCCAPRYIIEPLLLKRAAAKPARAYRITAIGFGTRDATRVVLQAMYRRADPAPAPASPFPAGRISWREVANWEEQHAAATK